MRRTIFLALLAALLLVPAAAHAAADPIKIIRDCEDDGVLQGNYTASELRKARSELPTDIDEYSDCRDVLSRAIAAEDRRVDRQRQQRRRPAAAGAGGGSTGGDGGSTHDAAAGGDRRSRTPRVAADPGIETGPVTDQDWKAVGAAEKEGEAASTSTDATCRRCSPPKSAATACPSTLIVVLALLAATLVAACLLPLRRRVPRHRAVGPTSRRRGGWGIGSNSSRSGCRCRTPG